MCFSEIAAIGTLLGGVASLTGIGSRGEKKDGAGALPPPPEPVAMPVPDDEAARKAARSRQLAIQKRSGRAATFLSELGQERLG